MITNYCCSTRRAAPGIAKGNVWTAVTSSASDATAEYLDARGECGRGRV